MANAEEVAKETPKANSLKKKDGFVGPGLSFLILFPLLLMMLPTAVFLFLGMLPTLVALMVETKSKFKYKYKWLCIGGVNFAGCLPFLFQMWFGDNSLDAAIALFMNVSTLIVVYGSAAIGWIFFRCIPPLVLSFLEMTDQRRVVHLRDLQKRLIEKWGEEVSMGGEEVKKQP
ncbi:MAG: acyl-CoA synthetase [Alphaproteobacteria bacterium]|jgi:hypothetical protein